MNKFTLISLLFCLFSTSAFAQYDDIYFNPKTDIPKEEARKIAKYFDEQTEETSTTVDEYVSLTEEDYTYTQRLNAFHNENLLVHITGNDTVIYDLADGNYNISVDEDGINFSSVNTNIYNPYYSNYYNSYWNSWNTWYGYPSYYNNYYSYWGWMPSVYWSSFYYDPWYYSYYPYYYPYYNYYTGYNPYYYHYGNVTYSDMSNEVYRRQHNSAPRYDGTRSTVSTTSPSTIGARNSNTRTSTFVNQNVESNTRRTQSTVSNSVNSETRSSNSTVRVTTSSPNSGSRSSGNSSSSVNSSGSRSGFSTGSGTRSSGPSSGFSGGSRGGGSSSSRTTRR